jgi:hypothetical protein
MAGLLFVPTLVALSLRVSLLEEIANLVLAGQDISRMESVTSSHTPQKTA